MRRSSARLRFRALASKNRAKACSSFMFWSRTGTAAAPSLDTEEAALTYAAELAPISVRI